MSNPSPTPGRGHRRPRPACAVPGTREAAAVTQPTEPVCQWCGHPTPDPGWWDGKPQCRNPHACNRRIAARTDNQEQQ